MAIKKGLYTIISNAQIATQVYKLKLLVPDWQQVRPGQFVEVQIKNKAMILRRPISIADWDNDNKILTLIYKVLGSGTQELSTYSADTRLDIFGPLGNGFTLPTESNLGSRHCLLVGGGVGVPPLYELGKQLVDLGHRVQFVLGFKSRTDIFLQAELADLGRVNITTEDGSYGVKGRIDAVLPDYRNQIDLFYACGPLPLLWRTEEILSNIEGYSSYEARMACGIGACYGCCVKTDSGLKRVCKDGPVFAAGTVIKGGI